MSEKKPLIEVNHLKQYFDIPMGMFKSKPLKAVDDVSFFINKGETLGLVGESGCGKTTVGRTMLHLYKPTAGSITYNGKEIKTKADVKEFRKKATMVFQDPYSSLNPRMTVEDIITTPSKIMDIAKDIDVVYISCPEEIYYHGHDLALTDGQTPPVSDYEVNQIYNLINGEIAVNNNKKETV